MVNQIDLDDDGNIYVAGSFEGDTDFDPNPFEETVVSDDDGYMYVAKFDSDGNFQWVETWGTYYPEEVYGLEVGSDGGIYAVGKHASDWEYTRADGSGARADWFGGYDMFLARLNPDGHFAWVRSWGSDDFEEPGGVSIDDEGTIWVCGTGFGEIDLDPGSEEHIFDYGLDGGAYIVGLDANGSYVGAFNWIFEGGVAECNDILALDSDTIYITGNFNGDIGLDDYDSDTYGWQTNSFIIELGSYSGFRMLKTFNSSDIARAFNLGTDAIGNIYITGDFSGTLDFGSEDGSLSCVTDAESSTYIIILEPDGSLLRGMQFGNDEGWSYVWGTAVDSDGNVYVTGDYHFDWPQPTEALSVDRIYVSNTL